LGSIAASFFASASASPRREVSRSTVTRFAIAFAFSGSRAST
jgi:hypothetical protein